MAEVVRVATFDDIDILVKARFDYFAAEKWEVNDEKRTLIESQLQSYFKNYIGTNFFAVLVEIDGELASVAFLAISEKPANLGFPTGKIGTILNVLTYPQYRKMGYATKALYVLIDEGKKQNLSYIELSASESGKSVYQKFGFIERDFSKSHFTEMKLSLL